ncbi:MAG: DUF3793 family protein [Hespellia sp.]|nr:DUF3793 family protein [Hespellia sp.]
MPKEVLRQYLGLQDEYEKKKLQLILQCAPLLKGVKMSCILVMEAAYLQIIAEELRHTQICLKVLCRKSGKYTILLYRENLLEIYLSQENVTAFLKQYGYQKRVDSLGQYLSQSLSLLGKRVSYFRGKEGNFPHEIGVFLGYPLEDVIGFIENAGKNFLLNGYWKVYADAKAAKVRFQSYDEAKITAAKEMFAGKTIREIAG